MGGVAAAWVGTIAVAAGARSHRRLSKRVADFFY
jgi:hypothetical protein